MGLLRNIRHKLLGLLALSLTLSFALAAGAIYVFVSDFHSEAMRDRFRMAVSTLRSEVQQLQFEYQRSLTAIAADTGVVASINMISQYGAVDGSRQEIFDAERRKLAGELRRLTAHYPNTHIALVDTDGRAVSVLSMSQGKVVESYLAIGGDRPGLKARDTSGADEWVDADAPTALRVLPLLDAKQDKISWHGQDGQLLMVMFRTILKGAGKQRVGAVVLVREFGADFAAQMARSAGVDFTIRFDSKQLPANFQPPLLLGDAETGGHGWTQTAENFIEARSIGLADGSQAYLAFSASTELQRSQVSRVLVAIFVVLLISALLVLLLGQVLGHRWISQPVQDLVASIDAIKQGDYAALRKATRRRDEFGVLSGALLEMSDTVKQREAEIITSRDSLAQSESRLSQVMAVTGEGIWDWDLNGDLVRHNARWCSMLGLGQEFLEHRTGAYSERLHDDDRQTVMQRIQDCLEGKGSYFSEHRMYRGDGRIIWVQDRGDVVERDAEGKPSRMLGSITDITTRMETRAALEASERDLRALNETLEARVLDRTNALQRESLRSQTIIKTSPDAFFAVDASGRLRDVNPASCALLGYSRDELLNMTLTEVGFGHDGLLVDRTLSRSSERFDANLAHKSGASVEVEMSVGQIGLGDEKMTYLFVRDIARRKLEEAELRRARDEAQRANAAKSEFLSRMSHELRTPLNAILGFGQLVEMEATTPVQSDYVGEILRAGQHLLLLINDVLDLARVESGRMTVSLEPVLLSPLVDECLALLQPQASARGVRLLRAAGGSDLQVLADSTRLKQVLLNLLSNAIKYNKRDGTVTVLFVSHAEGGERTVCVRINDTGGGLTPEQQAKLFVPFERLDVDPSVEGTGIGLALTKRLVELMGGDVGVESTPGMGSSFWIRLVATEAPARLRESHAEAAVIEPVALVDDKRYDVLCIEDNPANLRLIESIFARRPDVRLLTAIAPGLGLELARSHQPALILLDINLPDMDGYEVMESLRESEATRSIPVVAISANAMPKDLARGRAAGFVDYVTKPFDLAHLLQVIDRHLEA